MRCGRDRPFELGQEIASRTSNFPIVSGPSPSLLFLVPELYQSKRSAWSGIQNATFLLAQPCSSDSVQAHTMSTAMTPAQAAAVRAALTETWCLYGFGTLAIILRTISRVHIVGVRGFDFDDYAIWFGWVRAHLLGSLSLVTDALRLAIRS